MRATCSSSKRERSAVGGFGTHPFRKRSGCSEHEQKGHGALSGLLIAAGAIPVFAVERQAEGVNLETLAIILMVVGGIGLLASVIRGSMLRVLVDGDPSGVA